MLRFSVRGVANSSACPLTRMCHVSLEKVWSLDPVRVATALTRSVHVLEGGANHVRRQKFSLVRCHPIKPGRVICEKKQEGPGRKADTSEAVVCALRVV